jgi:prepilin-type N-terminal cleavage/methylation domain-containing protein
MLRNQKGFTLMELMIVIVIIGVLAAIGVPAYRNYIDNAKKQTCAANRRTLATAVGLYMTENNGDVPDEVEVDDLKDYMTNADAVKCPAGGNYSIEDTGAVTCDAPGHRDGASE